MKQPCSSKVRSTTNQIRPLLGFFSGFIRYHRASKSRHPESTQALQRLRRGLSRKQGFQMIPKIMVSEPEHASTLHFFLEKFIFWQFLTLFDSIFSVLWAFFCSSFPLSRYKSTLKDSVFEYFYVEPFPRMFL